MRRRRHRLRGGPRRGERRRSVARGGLRARSLLSPGVFVLPSLLSPGVGMRRLETQLGVASRELERPMTHLKLERRVRSVGRYQSMRYFPLST